LTVFYVRQPTNRFTFCLNWTR